MIRTLEQIEQKVLTLKKKYRIAVAWAQDTNTIGAIDKAVKKGFIDAILIGKSSEIRKTCKTQGVDEKRFTLMNRIMKFMHLPKQSG